MYAYMVLLCGWLVVSVHVRVFKWLCVFVFTCLGVSVCVFVCLHIFVSVVYARVSAGFGVCMCGRFAFVRALVSVC